MKDDLEYKKYLEGKKAFEDDLELSDNPYPDPDNEDEVNMWDIGWMDAYVDSK